jgi:hypothetical protein
MPDVTGALDPPAGRNEVSREEQWLIDRCAREFVQNGNYVSDAQILREAARADVELDGFFYSAPGRNFLWRRDPEGIVLPVDGLAHAAVATPLLAELLRFVRLCVETYLGEGEDPPTVTSEQLRELLGMNNATIDRIYKLFSRTEYFLTAGGGGNPPEWEYYINDLIRKFKNVATLDDYLAVRHQIVTPHPLPPPVLTSQFDMQHNVFAAGFAAEPEPQAGTVVPEPGAAEEIAAEENLVVFVSWAHESDEWQSTVLAFTDLLRSEGFDAQVDLYYKNRPVDWHLFGTKWIEKADVVLIVTSAEYAKRWASEASTGTGAGVAREAITLRRLFDEDQESFLHKVRVVLLPGVGPKDIPNDISQLSWIRVECLSAEGIDEVCRHLTGEDEFPMPDVGLRKRRGPKRPG